MKALTFEQRMSPNTPTGYKLLEPNVKMQAGDYCLTPVTKEWGLIAGDYGYKITKELAEKGYKLIRPIETIKKD